MSPRTWIAAFAVVAAASTQPRAEGRNEVRAVTFDEDGGVTHVHVRGAETPTFTVYKLERPARVVIDMPRARLAEVLRGHETAATFTPDTWAVSTIAAQQLDDGAVRVIVTLSRPGRYDVKTEGNELIVAVMPRDAKPLMPSAADLDAVKKQADAAKAEADAARAEADKLRRQAADQQARAEAAQRAVASASSADVAKAKQEAARAKADAEKMAKQAQAAQAEADRTRTAADQARRDALAEADRAKAEAAKAQSDATAARDAMAKAQTDAMAAKTDAQRARDEATKIAADAQRAREQAASSAADKQRAEAELVKIAADKQRAEADAARTRAQAEAEIAAMKRDADAAKAAADKQRAEAEKAKTQADRQRADAEAAKAEAARVRAEAELAKATAAKERIEAENARQAAELATREADAKRAEAEAARLDAAHAKDDIAKTRAEMARAQDDAAKTLARAHGEAEAAKAEVARAKAEAEVARQAAEAARAAAAADKRMAEADKQQAEAARAESERMLKDARGQLASLEKKQQDAQALEDHARAANAAAQAREEAAREAAAQAAHEREVAEAAAKQANDARDRAAASDRTKLASDARAAEERLAKARAATEAAEAQRASAEQAALAAKQDLEHTRSALAGVEQQRSAAVAAATEAARKRSEAEAAASDAARRRTEAETAAKLAAKQKTEAEEAARLAAKQRSDAEQAAALASKQKNDAEAQRVAAVEAAKAAKAAADAADKQRRVAEHAADKAVAAKQDAETSLAQLTTKRQAAERAAAEVEARSKAEAKAQAEVAAARARKAGDDQIAAARAEVDRLTTERKRAESELVDRRKAVAAQQAEATRLATAAAQARDAADREEARKTRLADERVREEQELAKLEADKQAKAKAQQVAAQVAAAKIAHVTNVTFNGDQGTGHVELAAMGDTAVQLGEVTPTTVEVIVDHAELAPKLERTLDVSKFGSPVRRVSSYRDRKVPGRVRIVAELSRPASPTVDHDASGVHLHFVATDVAKHMPRTQNIPPPVMGGFGAVSTPVAQQSVSQVAPGPGAKKHIYHGATVDFDFKDAPIHDLLRIIGDVGHVSVVVPDTIDAKVTVRLKRVPWDQALEVILASHGLWYRREGTIYRIATRKEIDTEDQEEAARREAAVKAEAPQPQVVTLNYANATELKTKLEGMLSPKGHIEVDERTNALIVNDIAGNRAQIYALARGLDTQTPQITIEARIVEARSTFVRQFGVQWGGRALAGAAGGNATGLVWPSSIGIAGGNVDAQTVSTGVAQPSDFAVNLPAAVGTGEGGALGLSLGSVGGNFNINLRLSALEDEGTVRIISAPKITVLNNKEAKISQGVSIPISVVSAAGTNTQFVQADLALTVTPYVSQEDCAIAMNLLVTKNEPDFVNVGARGDPTILRKEARTQMLVKDGETSVLGGIYTRNSGLAYKKIPFLGDLPVLGWLFKNRRENDDRTEILVFITPKITNKASLRCTQ